MKKQLLFVIVLCLFFVACAPGPNPSVDTFGENGVSGFWMGLWHGMISGLTFIISLFTDDVHFYDVHNNGGWYNFGFVLGAGILFGGSGRASKD